VALYQAELRPDVPPPAELVSRPLSMAVGTTNLTFRDLFRYPSRACSLATQRGYVFGLIISNVIELEHANVRLAAIDAGVVG
jgi:hypothetical protein